MKCLERDSQKRISSSEAVNHIWFKVNFSFYNNNFSKRTTNMKFNGKK